MFYDKNGLKGFGETGREPSEQEIDRIVELLDELPLVERSSRAMKIASQLLEYAAFELAGHEPATFVAELVDASAKLNRSSSEVLPDLSYAGALAASRLQ
ncbi:MAG: hypothetical protein R8G34_02230 [Paracoccaceae bacterium]|nr:hypothetical protein [Paracoccaceae bacterium]